MEDLAHILLVDDNPGDIRLTQEAFAEAACQGQLHICTSAKQALVFLNNKDPWPNLIILDINMPETTGLELLKYLKTEPDTQTIPIIILSSSSASDDIKQSYQYHANSYINKPMDIENYIKTFAAINSFWLQTAIIPGKDIYE